MLLTLLIQLVSLTIVTAANWENTTALTLLPNRLNYGFGNNVSDLAPKLQTFTALDLFELDTKPSAFDSFALRMLFASMVFAMAAILVGDDEDVPDFYPQSFESSSATASPQEVAKKGSVSLSLRTLQPDELDEDLEVPEKDRIQNIQMVIANFTTESAKVAHPDLSFIYVHYRPQISSKMPFVLFFKADRNGKRFTPRLEEDGYDWEFKVDAFGEDSLPSDDLDQGFYAMHKVYVHFVDLEAEEFFSNPNKAVFKVQRATKPSRLTEETSTPLNKKNSLLKSIRKSLKTSLQGMAAALRMTPTTKGIDDANSKPKLSVSAPSLNLAADSDC